MNSEKVESDDCKSNSGEIRKWVVCGGGLLKEVLKVEHTDLSVQTPKDSSENIGQKEQYNNGSISEVSVTCTKVTPIISSACTVQFMQPSPSNGLEITNTVSGLEITSTGEKQNSCTSYEKFLANSKLKPSQRVPTCYLFYVWKII